MPMVFPVASAGGFPTPALTGGYVTSGLVTMWDMHRQLQTNDISKVANLVSAPADSSAQTATDLTMGLGVAQDNASYSPGLFTNGVARCTIAANTTFIESWSKDNAAFSWEVFLKTPASISSNAAIMGTTNSLSNPGAVWVFDSSAKPRFQVTNGSSNALLATADTAASTSTWYQLGVSIDETGNGFLVRNGAYDQVSAANTFSAAYSSPSASSTAQLFALADMSASTGTLLDAGAYIAILRIYNTALTLANFTTNYNNDKARFGLS